MIRAVIYCRTASANGGSKISLAVQEERCRHYCQVHGYEVAQVISDAGHSANTLKRPGLAQVRELVSAEQVETVVIASLDRLTRQPADWLILYDEFIQAGAKVCIVNDEAD